MTASAPLVSVLMSVRDGAPYLHAAIECILQQTFRDFEFIIVDDGSTDSTPEILASVTDPRLRLLRNPEPCGLTASLNAGLALSRGQFIARQDADDISHPERLARQVAFLTAHPPIAVLGSQTFLADAAGRLTGRKDLPLEHRSIWWAHLWDNALAHSSVMFRRAALQTAGGYDETYPVSQDYEAWSRLGERHLLANLPDRLVTLRVVESSITRTHKRPELIRQIQAQHFRRLFPGSEPSSATLDLIGLFRTRVDADRLADFRALFSELQRRYAAAHPARSSRDFARTLALQHERIGYNLLTTASLAGLSEIARAVRTWPPRAFEMPWLRIAALALIGDKARGLYERLRPAA